MAYKIISKFIKDISFEIPDINAFVMLEHGIDKTQGSFVQANGSFFDGIFLFAWMQILQIFLQVLQLGISIFSQELAGSVGLFGTGLLFWVLFGLINSWLDLGSNWRAAFCFLLGLIVMSICGSIFLVSVGFSPV